MFTDYKCGMAKYAWENQLKQIKKEYIDSGDVKLVLKDYPLGYRLKEVKLGEASHCAQDQGKFFEFVDVAYRDFKEFELENIDQFSEEIGLDLETFNECLNSGKYAARVKSDFDEGESLEVQGTPTFFINGKKFVGAQPYEEFKLRLDEELAIVG